MTVLLGDRVPAQCSDVGPGGLCLQLASVFVPGAKVHGSVVVGAQRYPFAGEVAWAAPGRPGTRSLSRVGIRFLAAPSELTGQLGEVELSAADPARKRVTVRRSRLSGRA